MRHINSPKWIPPSFLSFLLRIHFNISFIIQIFAINIFKNFNRYIFFLLLFTLSVAFTTFSNIYLHARILHKISEPFIPEFFELFRNFLYFVLYSIKIVTGNSPMLYCCKDYKKLQGTRDFFGAGFFFAF